MNPFKHIPGLYNDFTDLSRYGRGKAPHTYSVAGTAFTCMMESRFPQSVIVNGESGAGKTEACKQVMQFLAQLSSGGGSEGEQKPGRPTCPAGGRADMHISSSSSNALSSRSRAVRCSRLASSSHKSPDHHTYSWVPPICMRQLHLNSKRKRLEKFQTIIFFMKTTVSLL